MAINVEVQNKNKSLLGVSVDIPSDSVSVIFVLPSSDALPAFAILILLAMERQRLIYRLFLFWTKPEKLMFGFDLK